MKKCPFCGSDNSSIYGRVCTSKASYHSTYAIYWVECDICGARTKGFSESGAKELDWDSIAVSRARDAWERRPENEG